MPVQHSTACILSIGDMSTVDIEKVGPQRSNDVYFSVQIRNVGRQGFSKCQVTIVVHLKFRTN